MRRALSACREDCAARTCGGGGCTDDGIARKASAAVQSSVAAPPASTLSGSGVPGAPPRLGFFSPIACAGMGMWCDGSTAVPEPRWQRAGAAPAELFGAKLQGPRRTAMADGPKTRHRCESWGWAEMGISNRRDGLVAKERT